MGDNHFFFSVDITQHPVAVLELDRLAEFIEPNIQERLAVILGLSTELVANLRAQYREDTHGVSFAILRTWRNKNPHPRNRVVGHSLIPGIF